MAERQDSAPSSNAAGAEDANAAALALYEQQCKECKYLFFRFLIAKKKTMIRQQPPLLTRPHPCQVDIVVEEYLPPPQ